MNISKRKVVTLTDDEKALINKVIVFLSNLEDELYGEYDYSMLIDDLEAIKCKEYIIEDESHY